MANALAYGFEQLRHLAADRVYTVGESTVYDAVRASAGEYSRQLNEALSGFVRRTTDHQIMYMIPGSGTLQPLDEEGNPVPMRDGGHYTVAFPIMRAGTAFGANREARALMTVAEVERRTLEAQKRDADWMIRHMAAAIFDNVAWNYTDPEYGVLAVQPLANNDTVVYPLVGGTSATDNHYLFQAGAIADATSPFPTIFAELTEHPSNTGPIVVYAASGLRQNIIDLTNFVPVSDPDIDYGAASDTLRGSISAGVGDEVLGKVDGCWVVIWRRLPANYLIGWASGGGPVLAMREQPADSLQGLILEGFSPDGNHYANRFIRIAGFGVENRIGACVMEVSNGAYAIPTGYDAPQAE